MGQQRFGELTNLGERTNTPRELSWFRRKNIVQIAAGDQSSMLRAGDGTLYCMGKLVKQNQDTRLEEPVIILKQKVKDFTLGYCHALILTSR